MVWLALADTQWNKGILLNFVKEEAIKHIDLGLDLSKWEETPNLCKKRKQVLDKLKTKLLSEQPVARKPKVHKSFVCEWKQGDTFAYKLTEQSVSDVGLTNRYLVFHKVGEKSGYPSEIYPVVWVKLTKDTIIPSTKEELDDLEFIQICTVAEWMIGNNQKVNALELQREAVKKSTIVSERDECGYIPIYRLALMFTSKRNIPKEMVYLGNFSLTPPKINYLDYNTPSTFWKFAIEYILKSYNSFNLRRSPLYNPLFLEVYRFGYMSLNRVYLLSE